MQLFSSKLKLTQSSLASTAEHLTICKTQHLLSLIQLRSVRLTSKIKWGLGRNVITDLPCVYVDLQ